MRRFNLSTILILGTMAAFLTGCSRSPVAPDVTSPADPGAQSLAGFHEDDTPGENSGGLPNSATGSFTANDEGRLTVGRFTLDLHKNSLRMPATITLSVVDENATECQIVVVPAEAGSFQVPVELTAATADLDISYDVQTMFMWQGEWVVIDDAAAHPNQQNVVARLHQASACIVAEGGGKKNRTSE